MLVIKIAITNKNERSRTTKEVVKLKEPLSSVEQCMMIKTNNFIFIFIYFSFGGFLLKTEDPLCEDRSHETQDGQRKRRSRVKRRSSMALSLLSFTDSSTLKNKSSTTQQHTHKVQKLITLFLKKSWLQLATIMEH